ncbi:Pyrimidine nucleotide transporter, mitochondrial [Entomophthora muscae]|uniref:Pyrimidine nucleotide transporter, mitochondrial n=2 Tax=Entomophthora muscae TaxID=34485 RepID=A0ACC2S492_9FUNG|nr:Pyrimidine nucleotide transporter, mitochondrial [Entomophthora muscae]
MSITASSENCSGMTSRKSESMRKPSLVQGQSNQQTGAWLHFVAGGAGGFIGTFLFSPLEVIKTRFQSSLYQHNLNNPTGKTGVFQNMKFHVTDTLGSIRSLYKIEGGRALFKGLGPTLAGVVPSRSIYFFSYGNGKKLLTELNGGQETSAVHLASAACAGTLTATLTNPIWVIRTRLQLQSEKARTYRNSLHCIYEILRQEGTRGLYKGLSASYLGVIESTLQWVVYEKLKDQVLQRNPTLDPSAPRSASDWGETLLCAGTAKLFAAVVAYPHEVLRTRLRQNSITTNQFKYTGLIQCTRLIVKEEGVRGLYSGMTPHLLRVVPNAAVLFGTYEMIMHYFGGRN